jgi:hypothetical protein
MTTIWFFWKDASFCCRIFYERASSQNSNLSHLCSSIPCRKRTDSVKGDPDAKNNQVAYDLSERVFQELVESGSRDPKWEQGTWDKSFSWYPNTRLCDLYPDRSDSASIVLRGNVIKGFIVVQSDTVPPMRVAIWGFFWRELGSSQKGYCTVQCYSSAWHERNRKTCLIHI